MIDADDRNKLDWIAERLREGVCPILRRDQMPSELLASLDSNMGSFDSYVATPHEIGVSFDQPAVVTNLNRVVFHPGTPEVLARWGGFRFDYRPNSEV